MSSSSSSSWCSLPEPTTCISPSLHSPNDSRFKHDYFFSCPLPDSLKRIGSKFLHISLYDYQKDAINFALACFQNHHGALLGMDMGLGKTPTTTALIRLMYDEMPQFFRPYSPLSSLYYMSSTCIDFRTLIVCPEAVVHVVWPRWISTICADGLSYFVYHGSSSGGSGGSAISGRSSDFATLHNSSIVITTYGKLHSDYKKKFVSKLTKSTRSQSMDVDSHFNGDFNLFDHHWGLVVYDEIHVIRNGLQKQNNMATAVYFMSQQHSQYQIGLTGTILSNYEKEIMNIARALNIHKERNFYKCLGPESKKQFIDSFTLRVSNQTLGIRAPPLPAKQEFTVVCVLTEEQIQLNGRIMEKAIQVWKDGKSGKLGMKWMIEVLKLWGLMRKACNGAYLVSEHDLQESVASDFMDSSDSSPDDSTDESDIYESSQDQSSQQLDQNDSHSSVIYTPDQIYDKSAKSIALISIIHQALANNESVVVFSDSHESTEHLMALVRETCPGQEPLRYDCSINTMMRKRVVDLFSDDTKTQHSVLFCGIRSGSMGISLTRANVAIFVDCWFNPSVMWQASGRIWRATQKKAVRIYQLVSAGRTLDLPMRNILRHKAQHVVPIASPDITGYEYDLQSHDQIRFKDVCEDFFRVHSRHSTEHPGKSSGKSSSSQVSSSRFHDEYVKSCDSSLCAPKQFRIIELKKDDSTNAPSISNSSSSIKKGDESLSQSKSNSQYNCHSSIEQVRPTFTFTKRLDKQSRPSVAPVPPPLSKYYLQQRESWIRRLESNSKRKRDQSNLNDDVVLEEDHLLNEDEQKNPHENMSSLSENKRLKVQSSVDSREFIVIDE